MYEITLRIHSLLPYLFLIVLVIVMALAILELPKKKFSPGLKALARVGMILGHIQLLFGLLLLFLGDRARAAFSQGMGEIMKDSDTRLALIEHPMVMIIVVALLTIGFSRSKRAESKSAKTRNILIFYGIGLALALSRIPYAAWFNL